VTAPGTDHDEVEALRDALRTHHPIMRSETGLFSGCRCGQVRLGQDVIAHVVGHLAAALAARRPAAPGTDHDEVEAVARWLADEDAAIRGAEPYADLSWAQVRDRWRPKALRLLEALAARRPATEAEAAVEFHCTCGHSC
jgi:hypothetical protein